MPIAGLTIPPDEINRQRMRAEMLRRATLLHHGLQIEEPGSPKKSADAARESIGLKSD